MIVEDVKLRSSETECCEEPDREHHKSQVALALLCRQLA
jgi:hypothetical protein